MKRSLYVITPTLLFLLSACSQVPEGAALAPQDFGTSSYDDAFGVAPSGAGAYVVGETDGSLHGDSLGGGSDAYIRRYDAEGTLLWGKQFGTSSSDAALAVATDAQNSAYVGGETGGSFGGVNRGGQDGFISKVSSGGSVLWSRQLGDVGKDDITSVASQGSGVFVVGSLGTVGGAQTTGAVWKFNQNGALQWGKRISQPDTATVINDVALDSSGNAYVVGYTTGALAGANGGGDDMFIRKYSSSGTEIWTKQLHYSDGDLATGVSVSGSSVYLAGTFYRDNNSSDNDVRVIKFTTNGTEVWNKVYGNSSDQYVRDISAGTQGVVFGGRTEGSWLGLNQGGFDAYVYKIGSNGVTVWRKLLGSDGFDATLSVYSGSTGILASGYTTGSLSNGNNGFYDGFVTKLSGANGDALWID